MHCPSSVEKPGNTARSCELTYNAPSWACSAGTPAWVATDAMAACIRALLQGHVPLLQAGPLLATQGSARSSKRAVRRNMVLAASQRASRKRAG